MSYYSDVFNFIELRATYYRRALDIEHWIQLIEGKRFKFSPWVFKGDLFFKNNLRACIRGIEEFVFKWNDYPFKRGPFILSIPWSYCKTHKNEFLVFLQNLPTNVSYVVDLSDAVEIDPVFVEIIEELKKLSISLMIKDFSSVPTRVGKVLFCKINVDGQIENYGEIINKISIGFEEVYISIHGKKQEQVIAQLMQLKSMLRI